MRTVKTVFVSTAATLLLAVSPVTHAQSQDDLALMQTFLSIMTDYLHIIDATHGIVSDSERAAIMQMQKIQEAYEERGEKARVAEVLRDVLENSRNPAIRNAAYIKLGDILKETGRTDEAIALLREGLNENINASN